MREGVAEAYVLECGQFSGGREAATVTTRQQLLLPGWYVSRPHKFYACQISTIPPTTQATTTSALEIEHSA